MRLLIPFLLFVFSASAQKHDLEFYIGGGPFFYKPTGEYQYPSKPKLAVHGGFNYAKRFNDRWSITTGLNLNQRAWYSVYPPTYILSSAEEEVYESVNYLYLSIPVLAGVHYGQSESNITGYTKFGLSFGTLVAGSIFTPSYKIGNSTYPASRETYDYQTFVPDFSFILETGLRYRIGDESKFYLAPAIGTRHDLFNVIFGSESYRFGVHLQLGIGISI